MLLIYYFIGFITLYTTLANGKTEFEGNINVVKYSLYDTSYCSYYVKNNLIRIDEFNADKEISNVLIVDTKMGKITALNPQDELYTELKPNSIHVNKLDEYSIIKTSNFKYINGYKCYQWRVKNSSKNTEIAYWVTYDNFHFFNRLNKILRKFDYNSEFFSFIPKNSGYLPILTVERTLVRDIKNKVLVTSIQIKSLNQSLFQIPQNYKPLEKAYTNSL